MPDCTVFKLLPATHLLNKLSDFVTDRKQESGLFVLCATNQASTSSSISEPFVTNTLVSTLDVETPLRTPVSPLRTFVDVKTRRAVITGYDVTVVAMADEPAAILRKISTVLFAASGRALRVSGCKKHQH